MATVEEEKTSGNVILDKLLVSPFCDHEEGKLDYVYHPLRVAVSDQAEKAGLLDEDVTRVAVSHDVLDN